MDLQMAAGVNSLPFHCYENEDIEGWLVDEGIGYLDGCGNFQYGTDPAVMICDIDVPDLPESDGF